MSLYVKGLPEHTRIVKPEKRGLFENQLGDTFKFMIFGRKAYYKVLITNSTLWLPALGNRTFWEQWILQTWKESSSRKTAALITIKYPSITS